MFDLIKAFGEEFGLLPLYAAIIAFGGFSASNIRHLFFVLFLACGLYITMFKAFNLKAQFGMFDVTQYLPVSNDIGNMIVAAVFVCAIGFTAYGVKRIFTPQSA